MKKEIPTSFRKDGFDISLLERQGDVALYVKTRGLYKGYEVMIVRTHNKDYEPFNIKAGDEYLPCTNDWGTFGFTYADEAGARKKIKELLDKNEERATVSSSHER